MTIDFWDANIKVVIAYALALILGVLLFIAYRLTELKSLGKKRRK